MVAVVDALGRVLYANSCYPGSCHDSPIWARKKAMHVFNSGRAIPGYRLLADSGFVNGIAIMLPYRERAAERDQPKARFNRHTRRVVRQAFGSWKRRFPILYSITRIEPPMVQEFINVCIVLYDIAIELGEQSRQEIFICLPLLLFQYVNRTICYRWCNDYLDSPKDAAKKKLSRRLRADQ
ncbi:hypothetical protein ANCCEY_04667 [Ancylostoma ceylanicum]|uniref:DDE Tnp4 domain-containing protein n=1 Tax=Ancylostoma ceylanicum TaxID=53326 RepID=A0A0D6LVZ2_9BILA|nr:hypothetical protein ANCCEY_04667 [Ancylostoma ceylanicum]